MARDPFGDLEALLEEVYAYVAYRVGDGPDAEDITSQTFERAFRYRSSFDEHRGAPIAWLIGIARRCIAEAPRPAAQSLPVDNPGQSALTGTDDETVLRLTVRSALTRLPDDDRDLLALRYGADLTTRQIAEVLELRPNVVDIRLSRARGRLRDLLASDG